MIETEVQIEIEVEREREREREISKRLHIVTYTGMFIVAFFLFWQR